MYICKSTVYVGRRDKSRHNNADSIDVLCSLVEKDLCTFHCHQQSTKLGRKIKFHNVSLHMPPGLSKWRINNMAVF